MAQWWAAYVVVQLWFSCGYVFVVWFFSRFSCGSVVGGMCCGSVVVQLWFSCGSAGVQLGLCCGSVVV